MSSIVLHALAAETVSGTGAAVDVTDGAARLAVAVNSISGAGATLTILLETSDDGGATWRVLATSDPISAVGFVDLNVASLKGKLRARWTIAGAGPSVSFAITGATAPVYASLEDLHRVGVSAETVSSYRTEAVDALIKRSSTAAGYIAGSGKWILPLTSWGEDLRLVVAELAGWDVLSVAVGYSPEDAANGNHRLRAEDALRWLRDVSEGRVQLDPLATVDSTPTVVETGVEVYTETSRGWGA